MAGCGSSGGKPTDGSADRPRDAGGDTVSHSDAGDAHAPTDVAADVTVDAGVDAPVTPTVDAPVDVPPTIDAAADLGTDATADANEAGPVDAGCNPGTITGSHVVFEFDPTNAEWVKSVKWRDSTGTLTDNLTGYGGGPGCTAPYEFFGQAFAAPEGNGPYPVGGDNIATLSGCGADQTIVSKTPDCANAAQIPVTTVYHFYDGAKSDQVRVTRTIGFDATTGTTTGVGMRMYVPRLALGAFSNVLIPNGAGTATTTASANACGGDCFTQTGADWNGKWFADVDPTSGRALIVVRDPSLTTAVSMTVNNDGASGTNLSSFVVLQPTGGWTAPLTEVEYLCFADLTTWPQTARDAATLPANCGP